MSNRQFDLTTFITDNYYTCDTDVFDELDSIQRPVSRNRFSFSIPEDVIPPPPPSSPDLTPRLTIDIPEDKHDDVELTTFELDSNPPTPSNIQFNIDFNKDILLISSDSKQIYRRPPKSSIDARKVWRYAKIPSIATIREIEYKLLDWAFTYASLEITDKKIKRITWRTHSNCVCSCSWPAFLRWIVCASTSSQMTV
jgi:hypothetical protein